MFPEYYETGASFKCLETLNVENYLSNELLSYSTLQMFSSMEQVSWGVIQLGKNPLENPHENPHQLPIKKLQQKKPRSLYMSPFQI